MPLDNHMDWATARDSGRLLLNSCSEDVPGDFWRNVYNIGGGDSCRLTAYQFLDTAYGLMGVDFRELEDPNWYATRNFHGQWYYDSDQLNDYLHFRSESVEDVFERIRKKLPLSMRILKYLPKKWVKEKIMRKQALRGDTPLNWIENNKEDKINAFFGSKEKWEQIPGWEEFVAVVDRPHKKLDHGYDEEKDMSEFSLEDMQQAAEFRGGKCLSGNVNMDDLHGKLKWSCAQGHEYEASPFLVLKTGHWCPECMKPPWNFDEQARSNPFLAQMWYADHELDEDNKFA